MAAPTRSGDVRVGQRGFTYIGLLFAIAVLGITLAAVGTLWSTQARRDKEAQLLWTGEQYRIAIVRYRAGTGRLPMALEDLVTDNQSARPRHFIRRLYPDPMTGQADWQVVEGPNGGILGIASSSQDKPFKLANFPAQYRAFEDAQSYADWKFVIGARAARPLRVVRPAAGS
jgi:type II secretory pathway pseudopilin PulG